jgi:plasmid stabilization system protein ParE
MKREVLLVRQAEADLDAILTWLRNRSSSGARNWLAALEAALHWLEANAASCPHAPEDDWFVEEIRDHLFKTKRGRPYRLLFTVAGKQVRVLHIRGPGQDLVRPEAAS